MTAQRHWQWQAAQLQAFALSCFLGLKESMPLTETLVEEKTAASDQNFPHLCLERKDIKVACTLFTFCRITYGIPGCKLSRNWGSRVENKIRQWGS
eukprot:3592491-Amphidinium_carterae.2